VGPGGNEEGAGAGRYCVNYAMARKIALTGAERPLMPFLRSLCHQPFPHVTTFFVDSKLSVHALSL
jgi:hypothetical protein